MRAGGSAAVATGPEPARIGISSFHERSLLHEGHAAAFRIEAGRASATGALHANANENEIARFLGEAISLAKQMQSVMVAPVTGDGEPGDAAAVHILFADAQAGWKQSTIQVSLPASRDAMVTAQPEGGAEHVVAMLQHFLMR